MRVRIVNSDMKIVKEMQLDIEKILSVNVDLPNEDIDILVRENDKRKRV